MSSVNVVKGSFGEWSGTPNAQSCDFDQNLISNHSFAVNVESHEYDSVSGGVIRQKIEKHVSRFNYESLSAMH